MDKQVLNDKGVFSYGWTSVKKDFWYFVGITFVVMILSSVGNTNSDGGSELGLVGFLLSIWITCGYTALYLKFVDGTKPPFGTLFGNLNQFLPVLGATILVGLITGLGLVFLIIPGIYFALKYQFTVQVIIDQKLGVFEAMKVSANLTNGNKMALFWFNLRCVGVALLGLLALGVGLLVAIPVIELASFKVYRSLSPAKAV